MHKRILEFVHTLPVLLGVLAIEYVSRALFYLAGR
jgi:hypothetical protein